MGIGLIVGGIGSFVAWELYGQNLNSAQNVQDYALNVPLTYTKTRWTLRGYEPDEYETEERFEMGGRRSDGSWFRVTYERSPDGKPFQIVIFDDLDNARSAMVDSLLRSVTMAALDERSVRARRNRAPCVGETVSPVLDYEVVRSTYDLAPGTSGAGLRLEVAYAPSLGCLEMERAKIITYEDGSERIVALDRVVNVQLGEPDNSWFDVPIGYTEMSPVERLRALQVSEADLGSDQILQRFELNYQERRP